jgi:hypothetical protein
MPTLMPWTTVEIGDVDIFSPALPSLVVYTWYVDDEPESSVVYFWRDENTGIVHHELVFVGPATFETAVAHAKEKAPERSVERIHVKHARQANNPDTKAKPAGKAKTKPTTKISVGRSKKPTPVKKTTAPTTARRKQFP